MAIYGNIEAANRARERFWRSVKPYNVVFKRARKANELTQAELALAAGVTQSFISRMERGLERPGVLLADRLADLLDIPVDTLMSFHTENGVESLIRVSGRRTPCAGVASPLHLCSACGARSTGDHCLNCQRA